MSLDGGVKTSDPPNYVGVPIQSSVWTLAIAVGWGTFLIAGNLIDYLDFAKIPAKQSGGKGGALGKSGGNYDYTATIVLALCEGPVIVLEMAEDGVSYESLSSAGYGLIGGAIPQAAWSYLVTAHPANAQTYPGIAYLVAANLDLGSTPQVPNNNVVVQGLLAGTAPWGSAGSFQNADLALVIQDFLTNPRYGVLGFRSSAINTATLLSSSTATTTGDSTFQTYCRAMGWGFSPLCSSAESGASVLERWLKITNSEAVWSETALKFIPYGDTPVYGNTVQFLPNLTPIYDLDDDDFQPNGKNDPVQISRLDPSTVANIYQMEVTSADGYYSGLPIAPPDQASIEKYGEKLGSTVTAHEIIGATQGNVIANLLLQRDLTTLNTYVFKLDWRYCLLEPMDLVTITEPLLGMSKVPVRIKQIDEDVKGILTITADDFPLGIAGPTEYASQTTSSSVPNRTSQSDPINPPIIFEPPLALSGQPEVWILISGGTAGVADPFWGGAELYISSDNISYTDLGPVDKPARQGVLTAPLAAYSGANPDTVNTLTVSLAMSGGVLISANALDASAGQTLCYVDGELIGFETATLVAANTYALTNLWRGMYGSTVGAHASGTQFGRTDDATYIYVLNEMYIGHVIYVKACSFNIFNDGDQPTSTAVVYTFVPSGLNGTRLDLSQPIDSGFNLVMGLI